MGLLIFSKIFGTILLMSWINQAFIVKHNTWVRRITIKNSLISIVFTKEVGKKPSKNYCKKMYEYSKWSPDNFTLDFGSIETISIHQNIFKTTFCLVFWILQFLQNVTFSDPNIDHILTWNQAYLWSSKICKTKFWYIWRSYLGFKLKFRHIFIAPNTIFQVRFE